MLIQTGINVYLVYFMIIFFLFSKFKNSKESLQIQADPNWVHNSNRGSDKRRFHINSISYFGAKCERKRDGHSSTEPRALILTFTSSYTCIYDMAAAFKMENSDKIN